MRKILFLSLIALGVSNLKAQSTDGFCGTLQTEEDLAWLRAYQSSYVPGEFSRGGSTYYIPTKVHIVGTDEGSGYYNLSYLFQAFCELNEKFAETGFIFYIYEDINYIDNSDYYEHNFLDGGEMMEDYNVNDVANIYFVADPAGNCGYFSPSEDAVAIRNSCGLPGNTTIAHEFGHFFSLPHTFYGWEWGTPDDEDQEWVNGDNCNSSADGFCDTPPDYLPYRWFCPGPEQTDPFGETFFSDGTLYMSYANDECATRFSEEQMEAMRANLLGPRNDFLDFPEPVYVDVTETPVPLSPPNLALENYYNYVELQWSSAAGAAEYHLQISFSPSFSAIAADVITSDTSYIITELAEDKTYYWRIRPLAPANTCEATSLAWSFNTGTLTMTDVATTDLFESLTVYPNPAVAGQAIQIGYSAAVSEDAEIELVDYTGRLVATDGFTIVSGNQTYTFEIPAVSEGFYLVRIRSGNQTENIRLFIAE